MKPPKSPIARQLGDIVRAELRKTSLTKFCARAGLNEKTVQRWLHDGTDPRLSDAEAIFNTMNKTLMPLPFDAVQRMKELEKDDARK